MGRYLKRLSKIFVITFIAVYCLIWLFSPVIIRYAVNHYGLPDPLSLTASSTVRYNPFTAHLTISDLEMKANGQESKFKLNSLEAELHLHQLWFDKIYVAQFSIDGVFIPVTMNESSFNIAGVELMAEQPLSTDDELATKDKDTNINFPYQVIIPAFKLVNAHVELNHFSKTHDIQLNSLALQNILLSKNEQDISLNLVSHLNDGLFALAVDGSLLKQQGEIQLDVKAKDIDLSSIMTFLPAEILTLDGKVSYAGKFNIAITEAETLININEWVLAIEDLFLEQDQLALSIEKQTIELQDTSASVPLTKALPLDSKIKHADENNIAISKAQTSVNINDLLVSIEQLHIEQNNITIDITSQAFHTKNLAVLLPANNPISVAAMLDFTLDGVAAKSQETGALLAEVAKLSANNIALQYQENIAKVVIDNVDVAKSQFSKKIQQNMPALAAFEALSVQGIAYTPELIAVNNITLSGFKANALLDKNKQLSTLVAIASPVNSNDAEQVKNDVDNEPISHEHLTEEANNAVKQVFSLGKFSLLDDAQIDFKDSSVTPHYERNVNITHLLLSDINTGKPEQEVLFDMQGKSDKYAHFDIKGRGFPFAEEQRFKLNGVVKELSLPSISSYIKHALKYEIESGQLDLTIDASLIGNQLNGDVDVLLRGVEFTIADDHERSKLTEQFSVPFNVALGMLKDSDGNVELSLPLSGDISSPSFGLSGLLTLLVKQATMSAAKDYLITTFVPYASVLKVAMAAGEYALKLRINDLHYSAGETQLTSEQLEFSRQMSVMLAERGSVNVKLCAIATANDIALAEGATINQAEKITRLKAISQQRVDIFKAYMVDVLNVPSARLLFCTSQIDSSKGAQAKIKFVI